MHLFKNAIIEQFWSPNTSFMVYIVVYIKRLELYLQNLYVERKVGLGLPKSREWRAPSACAWSAISQPEEVVPFVLETPAAAHAAGAPQALCINIRINAHFSFLLMVLLFKENTRIWHSGALMELNWNVTIMFALIAVMKKKSVNTLLQCSSVGDTSKIVVVSNWETQVRFVRRC